MSLIYVNTINAELAGKMGTFDVEIMEPDRAVFNSGIIEEHKSVVVLCELNKDENENRIPRSDFYGINFVQILRRKGFKGKVLFVSFLKQQQLIGLSLNNRIITTIGHGFLQLPCKIEEWKNAFDNILVLDDLALYDVQYHFSGVKQLFEEEFHHLRSRIETLHHLSTEQINICKSLIEMTYRSVQEDSHHKLEKFPNNISGVDALKYVKESCQEVISRISVEENLDSKILPKWKAWKVLWLDDRADKQSPLKVELELRGIEVLLCKSYQEAVQTWETHKVFGDICHVIVDYRLKSGEQSRGKQGYHFLKKIAEEGLGIGLMAYSGLTRKFLIESFKHFGIKVDTYSKIDFNQNNDKECNYLADEVCRLGDRQWMLINNQPAGSYWAKLKKPYLEYKESFEYFTDLKEISRISNKNILKFIQAFNTCKSKEDIWNLRLRDKLPVTTTRIGKNWTANKIRSHLKDILKVRRVAIGIYCYLQSNNTNIGLLDESDFETYVKFIVNQPKYPIAKINVAKELNKGKLNSLIKNDGNIRNSMSIAVLTFENDWPIGLLPEEHSWIKDKGYNIDLFSAVEEFWDKLEGAENALKTYFDKNNHLIEDTNLYKFYSINNILKIYLSDRNKPRITSVQILKELLDHLKGQFDRNTEKDRGKFRSFISLLAKLLQLSKGTSGPFGTMRYYIKNIHSSNDKRVKKTKKGESIIEEYYRKHEPWWYYRPNSAMKKWDKEYSNRKKLFISACIDKDWEFKKKKEEVFEGKSSNYKERLINLSNLIRGSYTGNATTYKEDYQAINRAIYFGIEKFNHNRNQELNEKFKKNMNEDAGRVLPLDNIYGLSTDAKAEITSTGFSYTILNCEKLKLQWNDGIESYLNRLLTNHLLIEESIELKIGSQEALSQYPGLGDVELKSPYYIFVPGDYIETQRKSNRSNVNNEVDILDLKGIFTLIGFDLKNIQ